MAYAKYIEIHDTKYFQSDVEGMTKEQIHQICSFLEKENDLHWVQNHCIEEAKHLVDNILFKL